MLQARDTIISSMEYSELLQSRPFSIVIEIKIMKHEKETYSLKKKNGLMMFCIVWI